MMRFVKGLLLLVVVVTIIGVFGLVLYMLFVERDTEFVRENLAAFLGAMIGFSLSFLAIWINKIIERRKLNYDTLVRLQYELDTAYYILQHNARNLRVGLRWIGEGQHYVPHVRQIRVDENLPSKLTNTGLINDLRTLQLQLMDFNTDLGRLVEMERESFSLLVAKDLEVAQLSPRDKAQVQAQMGTYVRKRGAAVRPHLQHLSDFCGLLDDKIIDCLSKAKVITRQEKPLYIARLTRRYTAELREEAAREAKKIRSQLAEDLAEKRNEYKGRGLGDAR